MIESCTKKRMLFGITLLGGLTILVLIVESQWTNSTRNKSYSEIVEHNATNPSIGEYKGISCQPCPGIDTAINHRNLTTCCDKATLIAERKFLKFEGVMLGLAILSCTSVFYRENILRKRIIRRVARQLRASV